MVQISLFRLKCFPLGINFELKTIQKLKIIATYGPPYHINTIIMKKNHNVGEKIYNGLYRLKLVLTIVSHFVNNTLK